MNGRAYRARFRKIEAKLGARDPWEIEAEIAPLPSIEERKRIEAENPDTEFYWIGPVDI